LFKFNTSFTCEIYNITDIIYDALILCQIFLLSDLEIRKQDIAVNVLQLQLLQYFEVQRKQFLGRWHH